MMAILGSLIILEYATKKKLDRTESKLSSIILMSISIGVIVWIMNIIGIIGLQCHHIPKFNKVLLVISFLFSTMGSLFAFYILNIKNKTKFQYVISALVLAVAFISTHFVGIFSLDIPGDNLHIHWGNFLMSFSFALLTSFISLYFIYIPYNPKGNNTKHFIKQTTKSLIMGGLLTSMQYTLLHAVTIVQLKDQKIDPVDTHVQFIAFYIGLAAIFIFISFIFTINSDRERIVSQKRIADEKFKSLFHLSPFLVLELSKEGIIQDVNQAFLTKVGYSLENVKNESITSLLLPEDKELIQSFLRSSVDQSNEIEEIKLVSSDGSLFPISCNLLPIKTGTSTLGIYFVAKDISDQKKAQKKKQRAENELKEILRNQLCVINKFKKEGNHFVHTLIDGQLLYKVGLTPEDFIGKSLEELPLSHDMYLFHLQQYQKAWSGQEVTYESLLRGLTLLSTLKPVVNRGKVVEVVSTIVDITKQKQAEREMLIAKERADKANNAKTVFLSKMSHELRTPLNGVLGFTQVLEMDEGLTEVQRAHVKEILTAGRHLLNLINSILDLERIESNNLSFSMKEVLLNSILEESLRILEQTAMEQNIHLINNLSEQNYIVWADITKVKQVFINILENAIKYNKKGGKIVVNLTHEKDMVAVHIKDTGIGIPKEEIEKVFNPFYRGRSIDFNISGAGIGLSLVKQIVEKLNGEIIIKSDYNGTLVTVKLPRVKDDLVVIEEKDQRKSTLHVPYSTILYIEDNDMNRSLMKDLLKYESNIKLLFASTGKEGLEIIKNKSINLILLDINLPDMSGLDVVGAVREKEKSNIPIIAISANALQEDIEKSIAFGCNDYITKPIDIHLLYKLLNDYLKGGDKK